MAKFMEENEVDSHTKQIKLLIVMKDEQVQMATRTALDEYF